MIRRGCTLWFTGLSGSGKSTIASALHERLIASGAAASMLDGDVLRTGLCSDLGFTAADRTENIRRIAEVSKLLSQAGLVVLVSAISPFAADRDRARGIHAAASLEFIEVHVDAPLDVCEARDPKGLYRRARAGAIPHFTGIDSPYEPPRSPELRLRTAELDLASCVDACERLLASRP